MCIRDSLKPKAGIPTLAYLGDVDIAKELLEGQTLYMRTNKVRICLLYTSTILDIWQNG